MILFLSRDLIPSFADLHRRAFPTDHHQQWSVDDITNLWHNPATRGIVLYHQQPIACLLWQEAKDSVDILTIATNPDHQRKGFAQTLITSMKIICQPRITHFFLEVATDNQPARELYRHCGFTIIGERKNYYGAGRHAIVLQSSL